jgi:hypothetical protein
MEPLSDETQAPAKRGQAAWLAHTARVSERNAEARKAGKQRRQAYEEARADAHRAAERQRLATLLANR